MNEPNEGGRLIVYGHNYCGMSRALVNVLKEKEIEYEWRDVREGPVEYQEQLKKLAHGCLSVPTVIFPDGSVLVEPAPYTVVNRLQQPPVRDESIMARILRR